MADTVIRIVELQEELNKKTDELIGLRERIVRQIHSMDNPLQVDVLYKRYVEYKTWERIEEETHYSYQHLQRIHTRALKSFANLKMRQNEIK